MSSKPRKRCALPRRAWTQAREFNWTCSTHKCNCSLRNRRGCRRSSDTILRWQNSIGPQVRRVSITRCSRTSRRAPRQRRPITLAAAWTPRENQNGLKITSCEARLEERELRIRSKSKVPTNSQIRGSKLVLRVDFCRASASLAEAF